MKKGDEVTIVINGESRRAVVRTLHYGGTVTIEGLSGSGPMMGRQIRVLYGDLTVVYHSKIKRVLTRAAGGA
jgi:hypothetical protein